MQEKKINSLTGARFIAIMVIVCSHFEFLKQYVIGNIYSIYFHNPTMGVDFFFMLSGFGMMLSSIKKKSTYKENIINFKTLFKFSWKHVSKIYPIYVATLLFGLPYYILVSIIDYGQTIFQAIWSSVVQFIVCLTLMQSTTGMSRFSNALNGVSWFLSTLFCIYFISPIVIDYLKCKIKNLKVAIFSVCMSIFFSYILALLFGWMEKNTIFNVLSYVSPLRRIFYVICGMNIAQIYSFHQEYNRIAIFEYVSVILAVIWFFIRNTIFYRIGALVYIIDMALCSCVLYFLSLEKGKISKIFASKPMVYLGNISMYIFITHYLIRMYIDFMFKQFNLESITMAFVEIVVILFLTFFMSIILERYYKAENIYKFIIKKIQ